LNLVVIFSKNTAPYTSPDPHAGLDPNKKPDLYCWKSFCFNPDTYHSIPDIIPPGESRLLDVTFTPFTLGEQIVYLYIRSNDTYPPPGSVAYIRLVGTGVNAPTTSSPEFPSIFLPVTLIIGFFGTVLFIKRTREN
jgi:hypothetical protein